MFLIGQLAALANQKHALAANYVICRLFIKVYNTSFITRTPTIVSNPEASEDIKSLPALAVTMVLWAPDTAKMGEKRKLRLNVARKVIYTIQLLKINERQKNLHQHYYAQ